jgi:uncharacterized iron-regulated protein
LRILTFLFVTIWALTFSFKGKAQETMDAYKIYSQNGKSASFEEMAKTLAKNDVILFGEMHNNPIDHWLQIELVKYLANKHKLTLGAEMFERDDQLVLTEYLLGKIKLDHLKKEAKLWPNYETDYAALVEFAKENEVEFIATNVPRRYASLVSREGPIALDSLSEEAKRFLPQLPLLVDSNDVGYLDMRGMMGGHGHGMNIDYLIAAQALKDYSMASSIAQHMQEDGIFIHFNGSFHSQKFAGINTYLINLKPKTSIGVIASVESDDLLFNDEWKELGDFIIVTPSSMTKTH